MTGLFTASARWRSRGRSRGRRIRGRTGGRRRRRGPSSGRRKSGRRLWRGGTTGLGLEGDQLCLQHPDLGLQVVDLYLQGADLLTLQLVDLRLLGLDLLLKSGRRCCLGFVLLLAKCAQPRSAANEAAVRILFMGDVAPSTVADLAPSPELRRQRFSCLVGNPVPGSERCAGGRTPPFWMHQVEVPDSSTAELDAGTTTYPVTEPGNAERGTLALSGVGHPVSKGAVKRHAHGARA